MNHPQIILKDFRCFQDELKVPLAPMTILVGENSSGKSSFLAGIRLAQSVVEARHEIDFNEPPFLLGAFDEIAFKRLRSRRSAFEIGAEYDISGFVRHKEIVRSSSCIVRGKFVSSPIQPSLSEWRLECDPYRLIATFERPDKTTRLQFDTGKKHITITLPRAGSSIRPWIYEFPYMFIREAPPSDRLKLGISLEGALPDAEHMQFIGALTQHVWGLLRRPVIAVSPIRSRPERTYNPLKDIHEPEGGHVPMLLATLSSTDQTQWQRLSRGLKQFGSASGLFSDIEIRHLGKTKTGPFQIEVRVSGRPSNLVDVGYGISQILPIIVDVLNAKPGTTFLLQQPEVHLHPRAQAELASFLLQMIKDRKLRFVIETHSDHFVDRVRMEVRNRNDNMMNDIELLYFSKGRQGVDVTPITFDSKGNLNNAPKDYRNFFLQEERRFLGI